MFVSALFWCCSFIVVGCVLMDERCVLSSISRRSSSVVRCSLVGVGCALVLTAFSCAVCWFVVDVVAGGLLIVVVFGWSLFVFFLVRCSIHVVVKVCCWLAVFVVVVYCCCVSLWLFVVICLWLVVYCLLDDVWCSRLVFVSFTVD